MTPPTCSLPVRAGGLPLTANCCRRRRCCYLLLLAAAGCRLELTPCTGFDEATDGPYDTRTSDLAFPGISKAAAELLVARRVAGVGIDTASIDAGACKDFVVHKVLLGNNVYGIENLNTRLREVPPVGATLFVLPMKIHGSGAPARVVALCP